MSRTCLKCGKELKRKKAADGQPEDRSNFAKRLHCDRECAKRPKTATRGKGGSVANNGGRRLLTDESERAIAEEYALGTSQSALAERYGVSPHTITAAIKRASNVGSLADFAVMK